MPKLIVDAADETAEIFVVSAQFALKDRGVQRLETELDPGVYKVRAVSGRNEWQKIIAFREAMTLKVPRIEFSSAAPLAGTNRTHETHMDAAEGAAPPEPRDLDPSEIATRGPVGARTAHHESSLSFMARWWTKWTDSGPQNLDDPAQGASLLTGDGQRLLLLDAANGTADRRTSPTDAGPQIASEATWFAGDFSEDRFSGVSLNADPGLYTLSLPDGDGTVEQIITLLPGWRTHVFALYEPPFDKFGRMRGDGGKRLVDLSIHITRGALLMGDETARLTDAARFALADERSTATSELLHYVRGKFEAPMLGLYGAHLLGLLENKQSTASVERKVSYNADLFHEVVENSARIFGKDHPDIIALTAPPDKAAPLPAPPMLWRSWIRLLTHSLNAPKLVPPSIWQRTALSSHSRPFFTWRTTDDSGADTMLRQIQLTQAIVQLAKETERLDPAFAGITSGTANETARQTFVESCIKRFEAPRSVIKLIVENSGS